jgi:hypothetical protein
LGSISGEPRPGPLANWTVKFAAPLLLAISQFQLSPAQSV